jgi:hypothetical protein
MKRGLIRVLIVAGFAVTLCGESPARDDALGRVPSKQVYAGISPNPSPVQRTETRYDGLSRPQ